MYVPTAMLSGLSALLLFFSLALSPNLALAQQSAVAISAPKIDGLDVEPARRLSAGNELAFTL